MLLSQRTRRRYVTEYEPKPSPRPRLARMLRQWREEHGWSQQQVADSAALSRNYISLIEQGKATELGISVICALAATMQASPCDVFRWACIEEIPDGPEWIAMADEGWYA
jgi:transcriptional regulator with XRE-family HTH domain